MNTYTLSQTLSAILAWTAPLYCVVCDGPVEAVSAWPLCSVCTARLTVDGGRRCDICGKPIISELNRCMRC
ncbi:MAG: double zinc ribbon domain-containing protein, partial [Spirochaetota bacterium]